MSGVNRSLATSNFMGTRAGSGEVNAAGVSLGLPVTYIPARIENGVAKMPKASFTIFHNTGWTPANGEKATGERFTMWAYGRKAEQFAKWLSPGRAVDFITARHSFDGNHYVNGVPLVDHTGQPIIIRRQADIIQQFIWREEAAKWIANEIQQGRRPINWENPAHPDYELWRQVLIQRSAMVWDGQSQVFGFARVSIQPGMQINTEYYQTLRSELAKKYGNAATAQPERPVAPMNYQAYNNAPSAPTNPAQVPGNMANYAGAQNPSMNVQPAAGNFVTPSNPVPNVGGNYGYPPASAPAGTAPAPTGWAPNTQNMANMPNPGVAPMNYSAAPNAPRRF